MELNGTFNWWALTPTENEQPMSSNMEAQLQRTSQQSQNPQGTSSRNQRAGSLNLKFFRILMIILVYCYYENCIKFQLNDQRSG